MCTWEIAGERVQRFARRHLPVLTWLPSYSTADALGDAIAGLTVGLTLVPQAIAYASLAGLPSQYGLYSALPGGVVYALLGTCTEVSIQLTALVALLTASATDTAGPDAAVLLAFLAGSVQLLCGVLRLGFLVDFVSASVVQGFTLAAAVTIASSQLKALLGLEFSAQGFVETWRQLGTHMTHARLPDAALAAVCITTLLALRALKDVNLCCEDTKASQKAAAGSNMLKVAVAPVMTETLTSMEASVAMQLDNAEKERQRNGRSCVRDAVWLLVTGRNALVVVGATVVAGVLSVRGKEPFLLSGSVEPGLPSVQPPPFSTTYQNETLSFREMCSHLGSAIAVVPVVSILGNVAIAKAFARGRVVDASQEMVALGVCNLAASFFRSAPVAGSFTCSAVAHASGVRTPLSATYTATLVALSLAFLTQYFAYIPRSALGAVVVSAVIFMPDLHCLVPMWKASRWDLLPLGVTFAASLAFGVAPGLLAGVAVDMALLLFFTARPHIDARTIQMEGGASYVLVTPSAGLSFPCADHVRGAVMKALVVARADGFQPMAAVLDLAHAARADYSAALGLSALGAELRRSPASSAPRSSQPAIEEPPLAIVSLSATPVSTRPATPTTSVAVQLPTARALPAPLVLLNARPSVIAIIAAAAAPAPPPPVARTHADLVDVLRGNSPELFTANLEDFDDNYQDL